MSKVIFLSPKIDLKDQSEDYTMSLIKLLKDLVEEARELNDTYEIVTQDIIDELIQKRIGEIVMLVQGMELQRRR